MQRGTVTVSSREQYAALCHVLSERERQDAKWGDQSGLPRERLVCALAEEVGEVAEAVLGNGKQRDLVTELVQVAALAVQMIEHELAAGYTTGAIPGERTVAE